MATATKPIEDKRNHFCKRCGKRKRTSQMFFHNVQKKPTKVCIECVRGKQGNTMKKVRAIRAQLKNPLNTKLSLDSMKRKSLATLVQGIKDHFDGADILGITFNGDEARITYRKEEVVVC